MSRSRSSSMLYVCLFLVVVLVPSINLTKTLCPSEECDQAVISLCSFSSSDSYKLFVKI